MSANPFQAGGWDPFGDDPPPAPQQQPAAPPAVTSPLKPARAPPPAPGARGGAGATAAAAPAAVFDPFADAPPPVVETFDPFSSSAAAAAAAPLPPPSYTAAAELPPPPPYAAAADLPPPPSYEQASAAPPAYGAALDLPPPPSYEELFASTASAGSSGSGGQFQAAAAAAVAAAAAAAAPIAGGSPLKPARAAPPAPPGRSGSSGPGLAPARAAPPPPPGARAVAAGAGSSLAPARAAPPPPAAAQPRSVAANPFASIGTSSSGSSSAWGGAEQPPSAAPWLQQGGGSGAVEGLRDLSLADEPVGSGSSSDDAGAGLGGSYEPASSGADALASAGLGSDNALGRPECRPLSVAARGGAERQLCAHLRLAPLRPKEAAPLRRLVSCGGSLLAAPAGEGAQMLQWALSGALQGSGGGDTLPSGAKRAAAEDWDSAPCAELAPRASPFEAPEGAKSTITCVTSHPPSGRVWAGTSDGRVHCWQVAGGGAVAKWLHVWAAHNGKIKALAVTPWGRIFTGSAGGVVRLWSYEAASSPSQPPRQVRNLRKLQGGAPHGKVCRLALSAGGRVLWSCGRETLSLWSAFNGQHLGTLAPDRPDIPESPLRAGLSPAATAAAAAISPLALVAAAGVVPPPDPAAVSARVGVSERVLGAARGAAFPPDEGEGEEAEDAAKEALKTVAKGVTKAGKFLGKLGKRLEAAVNNAAAGAGALGGSGSPRSLAGFGGGGGGGSGGLYSGGDAYSSGALSSAASGGDAGAGGSATPNKAERWGSIKVLEPGPDGGMWVGYKRGLLEKYSETGQLLWSSGAFAPGITAAAAVGAAMWIGGLDGRVWALDGATGEVQRVWRAHAFPVVSIAGGPGPAAATLARDGAIRAWPAAAAAAPESVVAAWRAAAAGPACLRERPVRVLAGTWNVNEGRPGRAGILEWLGGRSAAAQVVVIGLQELEMGTSSVAMDRIYAGLARARLESGTERAQLWVSEITACLHGGPSAWRRVGLRQMSGVLLVAFVRAELEKAVGEVATASVACGVMGVGGNKGAVALSFSLMRRRIVAVCSHFAAHQEKVAARNADYAKIVRALRFHNTPLGGESADTGSGDGSTDGGDEAWGSGLRDADLLVWVGDFNYRVEAPPGFAFEVETPENTRNDQLYAYVHEKISRRRHLDLLEGDQLLRQARAGNVFVGLAEAPITFLPTYKFEKGRESSERQPFYDQGEKKRVPAWTDRVLFRGSAPQPTALAAPPAAAADDIRVSVAGGQASAYGSCLSVNDSDHKPVYCEMDVVLPAFEQEASRRASLRAILAAAAATSASGAPSEPQISLNPSRARLDSGCGFYATVTLRNDSSVPAAFAIVGPGPMGALPLWLDATPSAGVLPAGGEAEIGLRGSPYLPQYGPIGPQSDELAVLVCAAGSGAAAAWPPPAGGMAAHSGATALRVSLN